MHPLFSKAWIALCSLSLLFQSLSALSFEDQKRVKMIQDLEVIKHHFDAGYAPAKWKKKYADWDLEKAFEQAKYRIWETPKITTKDFQLIVRDFLNTMKDYHVDVLFFSTEAASLPFTVKSAQGRYFINWLDPLRLPPSRYAIRVGDEVLEFNERPIAEVIEELKLECGKRATPQTDQALAEMKLTLRLGSAGDRVPKGAVFLKTRSSTTHQAYLYQLSWNYQPEQVKNPFDFLSFLNCISLLTPSSTANTKLTLPEIKMANPLYEAIAKKQADHQGSLGANKSFVPLLGELIWQKENEREEEEEDEFAIQWHAYTYRHPNGASIGYIRIPHYAAGKAKAKEFGKILNIMEQNTDALVIDQVHNFGGSVHFQYELASMLALEPLKTPHHQIKITQREVLEAWQNLELFKLYDLFLNEFDEEEDDNEFEVTYQHIMFLKTYYELLLDEWNHGHTLTRPTPILGIDRINPHPKYRYTKPILMLIDEMDFSAADFMPAILQDNQRATLFGSRTAGAGGYVFTFEFPNSHGIALCSYTASIAERPNSQKIENLGAVPDIEYSLTVQDLSKGFCDYVRSVNSAVEGLLK